MRRPTVYAWFLLALPLAAPASANEGLLLEETESVEQLPAEGGEIEPPPAPESDEPPPAPGKEPAKKGPPPRFTLQERERFREWLQELCAQEPVAERESRRVRRERKRNFVSIPRNKQGSLRLLLENYRDDLKDPSPAGKEKKGQREQALKTEFFALRETSSLDEKSAAAILKAIDKDSTCHTRSVQTRTQKLQK